MNEILWNLINTRKDFIDDVIVKKEKKKECNKYQELKTVDFNYFHFISYFQFFFYLFFYF